MENAGKSTALAEALHSTRLARIHALKNKLVILIHGHSLRLIATNIGAEKETSGRAFCSRAKGCHSAPSIVAVFGIGKRAVGKRGRRTWTPSERGAATYGCGCRCFPFTGLWRPVASGSVGLQRPV